MANFYPKALLKSFLVICITLITLFSFTVYAEESDWEESSWEDTYQEDDYQENDNQEDNYQEDDYQEDDYQEDDYQEDSYQEDDYQEDDYDYNWDYTDDYYQTTPEPETTTEEETTIIDLTLKNEVPMNQTGIKILGEMYSGQVSDDVKYLQERLIALNYLNDVADGSLGPNTRAAIEKFQSDYNLKADGTVTFNTLKLLFSESGKNKVIEMPLNGQQKIYLIIFNYKTDRSIWQSCLDELFGIRSQYFTDEGYEYEIRYNTIVRSTDMATSKGYCLDLFSSLKELYAVIENDTDLCYTYWHPVSYELSYYGYYGPDYGYKDFIAVSISDQHLWLFRNGYLFLETPVVTGLPTESRSTPRGEFTIINHATGIYLEGEMDGESWRNYVNFWMAITWDGVGLHDSSWRGDSPSGYGGDIYTYNGSHGCINIPYSYTLNIFYNTYDGMPVIVY